MLGLAQVRVLLTLCLAGRHRGSVWLIPQGIRKGSGVFPTCFLHFAPKLMTLASRSCGFDVGKLPLHVLDSPEFQADADR